MFHQKNFQFSIGVFFFSTISQSQADFSIADFSQFCITNVLYFTAVAYRAVSRFGTFYEPMLFFSRNSPKINVADTFYHKKQIFSNPIDSSDKKVPVFPKI